MSLPACSPNHENFPHDGEVLAVFKQASHVGPFFCARPVALIDGNAEVSRPAHWPARYLLVLFTYV